MASSLVVDWPCALKILKFTLGTIIKMRGSTQGFSPSFVTWKKKIGKILSQTGLTLGTVKKSRN
jgi:hypothetical protein